MIVRHGLHKPAELSKSVPATAYWTYALAFLGAHLAFMPLFVLLLPRRVEAIAPDDTGTWLSWLLLTGGIVAGIANVTAGAIGDRWLYHFGNRRGLIAIGAGLLAFAYSFLALAGSVAQLIAAMIFFQIALNCCFSPLGALLADHFPDEVKGRLGGLMTASLPASTLLVLPIAWLFPADGAAAFIFTGFVVVASLLPLLVFWTLGAVIEPSGANGRAPTEATQAIGQRRRSYLPIDFGLAWLSRLLVQTGAAFIISYIYLYIAAMQISQENWRKAGASEILAALTTPAAILAIIATIFAGFISDRRSSRRWPLAAFAGLFALGMGLLAGDNGLIWFFVGYILTQTALAAYLSVDTALIAQLVSGHPRRGLLLGVMNLSNTLPSVIAPVIALFAFNENAVASILPTLFGGLACAAFLAGILVLGIRSVE